MITVLYVDDEELLLDLGKTFLGKTGEFTIEVSTSAPDAMEKLGSGRYDAIVSDYQMPEMNGIDFLRQVRRQFDRIPFILFTGKSREEVAIEALNNGADFYLQKGGSPTAQFAELEHKIRIAVERARGGNELRAAYEQIAAAEEELRSQYDELRQNQQVIQESEEKYRTLVEHSMDGVFIAQDGKFVFVNPTITAMTGYTNEELRGRPLTILLAPEDQELVSTRHRKRLAGETVPEIYEFSVIHKDHKTSVRVKMSVGAGKYQGGPATIGTIHNVTEERKREDEIRESEMRFHQIADATVEGLIMHKNRIIQEVNTSTCSLWGYTREELLGKDVLDLIAPASHARVRETLRTADQEPYEAELLRKDKTSFQGEVRSRNITFHGETVRLTSVRDITDRRQVEEALQKSEELHRKMIAAMPDIIVRSDLEGTILFVNDKATLLAGEPDPAAIIGKSMFSFFAPECLPLAQKNTRLMFERPLGPVEYVFRIRDGTRIHLEVNGDVLRTPDGTPYGLVFVCRNITERKQAETVLRESEENYRRIIENMQDVFYRLDKEGTITMISPYGAKIIGYDSPEEMIGKMKSVNFFADPGTQQDLMAHLKERGMVTNFPLTLVDRYGNPHYATTSSRVLFDASGGFSGVEGILHDVTDLMQAEHSLREANRKLRLLSDITRHDIKNKLTSLLGLLDLSRHKNDNPLMQENLDRLVTIAETISEQIEFTRDYQELGILEPRWSDVHEMVGAAASGVDLAKIQLSHDNDHVEIYADPLVEKVFYNLIDNAVRYGKTITRISISAGEVPEGCRILVEDDGIGIPAGDKEKIFGRGFGTNTGFGLFLTREILAITGISIHETGEPGKGARFEILVPKNAFRQKTVKNEAEKERRSGP